jgi:predicted Fe-S protein YdhL (DUF1289 family)
MSEARPLRSPCIGVCAVQARSGLCIGCRRSLKEITNWTRFSEAERTEILNQLPLRQLADALHKV